MADAYLFSIPSCVGGAPYTKFTPVIIRLLLRGCVNRPFFHIAVQNMKETVKGPVIEQLGVYDPLPNKYNEKVVGLNFNRMQYWIDEGAAISTPCKKLLGLSGYMPVHPNSFKDAWDRRKLILKTLEDLKAMEEKENLKSS